MKVFVVTVVREDYNLERAAFSIFTKRDAAEKYAEQLGEELRDGWTVVSVMEYVADSEVLYDF